MSVLAEMLSLSRLWMKDSTVRPHNQLVEDQDIDNTRPATLGNHVPIRGHEVEIVESFPYLGCLIHCTGECDCEPEIKPQSLVNVRWMGLDRRPYLISGVSTYP